MSNPFVPIALKETAHKRLLSVHALESDKAIRPERLPTNTTSNKHPVHRWFNFIAGFSPEFVQACIAMSNESPRSQRLLLDPFAGCGTSLVAARMMNLASIGYDPHPFFSVISDAKVNSCILWHTLPKFEKAIIKGMSKPIAATDVLSNSALVFLNKLFKQDTLSSLLGARFELEREGFNDNSLAFLVLSRMLDYCCLAATDGIYKSPTSKKRSVSAQEALERVLNRLREDEHCAIYEGKRSIVYTKSSERMQEIDDNTVDIIVTSPPYLNNFDFAEMTRMYLYFWGIAESWGDITEKVRKKLIVNTTTSLKGHKDIQDIYKRNISSCIRHNVDSTVASLTEKRKIKPGKKEYDLLVYPYLSQMQNVLLESLRVMKSKANFHMMISDAALYGIHLPTPQWIAAIMSDIGFINVECHCVRNRGHRWSLGKREESGTELGEYYIFGSSK